MGKNELRNKIESFKLFTVLASVAGFCVFVILLFAVYYAAGKWFGSNVMTVAIIPLSVTLFYAVSAVLLGFFQKRAAVEEEEKLLLEKRKERKATFESEEDALFTAGRTLSNYKKFAPYVISIISSLLIITLVIFFWHNFSQTKVEVFPQKAMQAAFIAFLLFSMSLFCGVFAIGQSRNSEFRWLRPVGVWFLLSAINILAASITVMLKDAELPLWDYYVSRIFMVVNVVLAAELLINFLIEFYRPRVGAEERPLFESRLLSFFTEPGGFLRNVADTLDYQFGFQVSGTWIYMFLERSLAPFLLIWLALLWLFTSLDEVAPGELGVRETFGVSSEKVLSPSVYFKLPWPIQTIKKIPVNTIQEIFVGPELKDEHGNEKRPDVVLWTESHYAKEGRFLIATDIEQVNGEGKEINNDAPVSMIAALLPVQFKVKPDKVLDYAYKHDDPVKTLKDISEKEITGYFASADMLKLMSNEREKAINEIQIRIQNAADEIDLGVDIVAVAFLDAHPPIDDNQLPQAFQEVVAAYEEKEAEIYDAKAYRARTIPQAEADALRLKYQAEAYKNEKTKVSKAEIKRFKDRMVGYRAMPEMYILNSKLDFLENDCKNVRKYIVPDTAQNDVYVINLEEKQRLDLLDISDLKDEK